MKSMEGKPARAESWHRRRLSAVSSTACGRKGGDGLAQRHIWEPAGSPQRGQALWTELSCGRGRAGGQGKHTGSTSGSPARRQGAGVVPPTGGAVATQSWPPLADATSQTGTPPPQAGDRRSLLGRRLPAQGFQERGRLVTRLGLDTPHGPASPPCYVEGQPGAPASERDQTVQKWGRARGRVKSGGAPHQNLLSVPTGQDAVSMMQRTGDHITTKIKELERVERGIRGHDGPGGRAKAPFQRPGPEYREAARTAGCGEVGGPCACLPEVIGSMQNAVLDQPRSWSGHGAGVGPAGADPSSSRWKASRYSLQWKNAAVRAQHAEKAKPQASPLADGESRRAPRAPRSPLPRRRRRPQEPPARLRRGRGGRRAHPRRLNGRIEAGGGGGEQILKPELVPGPASSTCGGRGAAPPACVPDMEVLRRSSVFAAEFMDAFDRSPTDKELVAQAKALGREFVHARLLRAGLAWSAPERAAPAPGGRLAEVCAVLLRLGDELELIRPSIYRNVARQLNVSVQSETVVTDAFLAVATQIFSAGITWGKVVSLYSVAAGLAVDCVRQAQPAVVHALVDCLGEFVRKTLVAWLRRRGGWTDVLKCVVSTDPGFRSHWLVATLCSFGRFLKATFFVLLPER